MTTNEQLERATLLGNVTFKIRPTNGDTWTTPRRLTRSEAERLTELKDHVIRLTFKDRHSVNLEP